jgi:hypothetical protein
MRTPSNGSLGVIALVPDDWHGIVMPRHQVLTLLASRFPTTVWVELALIGRIKSSVVGIGTFLKLSLLCAALPG